MKEIKGRLEQAHVQVKNTYDASLRKKPYIIHEDDYVYLRIERKNPN